jgi:hypothetical protein
MIVAAETKGPILSGSGISHCWSLPWTRVKDDKRGNLAKKNWPYGDVPSVSVQRVRDIFKVLQTVLQLPVVRKPLPNVRNGGRNRVLSSPQTMYRALISHY